MAVSRIALFQGPAKASRRTLHAIAEVLYFDGVAERVLYPIATEDPLFTHVLDDGRFYADEVGEHYFDQLVKTVVPIHGLPRRVSLARGKAPRTVRDYFLLPTEDELEALWRMRFPRSFEGGLAPGDNLPTPVLQGHLDELLVTAFRESHLAHFLDESRDLLERLIPVSSMYPRRDFRAVSALMALLGTQFQDGAQDVLARMQQAPSEVAMVSCECPDLVALQGVFSNVLLRLDARPRGTPSQLPSVPLRMSLLEWVQTQITPITGQLALALALEESVP